MGSLNSLLPIIQLAITPVILVSGMGALMIVLTNRMGRIVDRTRELAETVPAARGDDRRHLESQLDILWSRSLLIRRAVTAAGLSMLLSCVLIVVLLGTAVLGRDWQAAVLVLFALSVLLLIAALVEFLRDIFMALQALKLQVDRARRTGEPGSATGSETDSPAPGRRRNAWGE